MRGWGAPGGHPGRGTPFGPRRRVAGGGGRRRLATFGSGIAWWWSSRPVAAAVIIRWRPGRADPPVAPRGMSGRGARRGPALGGHLARAPGSTTSPPSPGARPRAAASAPGATGVARATRGGSRTMAGGIAGPRPRPEAAASSSRPSRVAPSRTSADTSSRGIRSLLSRGVAIPPDVRPWQARRPSVPGDHFPVPGTTVSFPEFVIQPIAVILPTSQTYPILREFSGVSRKKKASDPPFPIFSQTS